MTDYATDVKSLDDLPDPEELVSGEENVAYALGRRLLQPDDALEEIGDEEECDTIDLRDYLGESMSAEDLLELEARISRVLSQDVRVDSIEAEVIFGDRVLTVEANGDGTEGPFALVLKVDDVTATILTGG